VYWGGRLELFNQAGKLIASRRGPQDLTAVASAGPRLVVGDVDGRLTALALPANLP
jgi:sugar lactone lactonase YvrE